MNTRCPRAAQVAFIAARALKLDAGCGGTSEAMIDRSPLRSASERALALCAAALVHVVLALALPRAGPAVSSPSRSALALIELTPASPPPPPRTLPPEPAVPAPPAPEPPRRIRARARTAASSVAPAPIPTPHNAPPAPALALDPEPAATAPLTSDQPGQLSVHSLRAQPHARWQPQARSQPVSRALPAPAGLDRSRRLALAGGLDWRCAFPAEADDADVDRGTATLRIAADARGGVREVVVLRDSGHGFGRAARNCAFSKTFVPARAPGGEAVAGVLIVNVRFVR